MPITGNSSRCPRTCTRAPGQCPEVTPPGPEAREFALRWQQRTVALTLPVFPRTEFGCITHVLEQIAARGDLPERTAGQRNQHVDDQRAVVVETDERSAALELYYPVCSHRVPVELGWVRGWIKRSVVRGCQGGRAAARQLVRFRLQPRGPCGLGRPVDGDRVSRCGSSGGVTCGRHCGRWRIAR